MAAEDGLKAQKLLAQGVWMQNTLFFQGVLDVTYDTPPFVLLVVEFAMSYTYCLILNIDFFQFFRDSTFIEQKSTRVIRKIVLTLQP